jgi:hypothetical protein
MGLFKDSLPKAFIGKLARLGSSRGLYRGLSIRGEIQPQNLIFTSGPD